MISYIIDQAINLIKKDEKEWMFQWANKQIMIILNKCCNINVHSIYLSKHFSCVESYFLSLICMLQGSFHNLILTLKLPQLITKNCVVRQEGEFLVSEILRVKGFRVKLQLQRIVFSFSSFSLFVLLLSL